MSKHTWEISEIDGGSAGSARFWKCRVCGAGAGFAFARPMPQGPAIYENGSGLQITDDCAESKRLIDAFELGVSWGRQREKQERRIHAGSLRLRPEVELSDD